MRRAIGNLERLSDTDLFKELSEGISLIVDNAVSLDETAHRLYREKEFRASEIMLGFAEEEAAKFLILIDFVRCPRDSDRRTQMLNRFHDHVEKRAYANTCSYHRIASFRDLSELVESGCRSHHLDGPNGVDWIFPNSIAAEREQALYVDYVQDITDEAGEYHWRSPDDLVPHPSQYVTPDCVKLSRALSEAGAGSPDGLAEIANIWRSFKPVPDTGREELRDLIAHTLDRLTQCGLGIVDEPTMHFIVAHWPFPLWPLTMKDRHATAKELERLREERDLAITLIEETEAKRDPAPAISRSMVEELNDVYSAWKSEVDARASSCAEGGDRTLRIRSSADLKEDSRLPSYARLQEMFRKLNGKERAALLALGWFAREGVADWPRIYERAVKLEPTYDERYQIGCACYWMDGLNRWEEEPQPFRAGRWRRLP